MSKNVELALNATDRTKRAFRSVNSNFNVMSGALSGLQSRIGLLVGGAGLGLLVKKSIESGDQIEKLSRRLGIGAETLSEFRHVAELSGVSFEQLTNGIKKLEKSASDAAAGLSTPKRAFEDLNIDIEQFRQLDPGAQFEVFADAIAKVENPAERTRIAMDVMGRAGSDLITVMDGGSVAIRGMREEAHKLGLTLTDEQAKQYADVADSIGRMKGLSEGLALELTTSLLPAIKEFNETIVKITTNPQGLPQWLKDVQFYAVGTALEFKDLLDWVGAAAAIIDRAAHGDLAGIKTIIEARKENRAEMERTLGAYREWQNAVTAPLISGGEINDQQIVNVDLFQQSLDAKLDAAIALEDKLDQLYTERESERLEREKENAAMWSEVWGRTITTFSQGIGDAFADSLIDQRNFAEAMQSLFKQVAKQIISSLIQIQIQRAIMAALASKEEKAIVLQGVTNAETLSLAYAPAAAAVSLATLGANSTPAQLGITSTYALTQGLALSGQAHDGLDYVPGDGTYLLRRGEMVLDPGTSDRVRNNVANNYGATNIHIHADVDFESMITKYRDRIYNAVLDAQHEAAGGAFA